MAFPAQEAATSGAPDSTAVAASRPPLSTGPLRFLVRVAPPLVTLVVTLWGITGSSYWRDEAATMVAVHRSFGQLLRLLAHYDAVHGAYYILMWVIVRLGGTSELVTRLPSALAMAAAAALVAAIGSRVVSPHAGLAAGLAFGVVPSTSLYAQNARPDAMAVALAAGATYLLVRVLQDGATSWRWLAGYAACLAALGLIDILALLLIPAHLVTVVAAGLRQQDHTAKRVLLIRWLLAVLAALVVVSPLAWLALTERAALSWVKPLSPWKLQRTVGLVAPVSQTRVLPWPVPVALLVIIGSGLLRSIVDRPRLRRYWPREFAAISLPWLIVPPAIMVGISVASPIYTVRYILFCLPALALIVGTACAALAREAGAAAVVVLMIVGLPEQLAVRQPDGHSDNIRRADQIVAATMHRGDAAIFHNGSKVRWSWDYAYPYGFAQLRNIGQAETPAESGTLTGTLLPAAVVQQRLSRLSRVWVVDLNYRNGAPPRLHSKAFQLARHWEIDHTWLFLYTRGSRQ